jgi:putative transposase
VVRLRFLRTTEVLFLRRELALYRERGVKPRRVDAATRVTLAFLSRWFDWRSALVIVRPETLIGWHRAGFRLWWRWKCRSGRPPIPKELRELIRRMARENPAWGQERIANELLLKLGLQVSPRTWASTCRDLRQDGRAEINDGRPSFAIMLGPSSRVISVSR